MQFVCLSVTRWGDIPTSCYIFRNKLPLTVYIQVEPSILNLTFNSQSFTRPVKDLPGFINCNILKAKYYYKAFN